MGLLLPVAYGSVGLILLILFVTVGALATFVAFERKPRSVCERLQRSA